MDQSPPLSARMKRDKLKGTNGAKFAVFRWCSQIFGFFGASQNLKHFGSALRRKLQVSAGIRRPQETAEFQRNPFVPLSLSLLIPPYTIQKNPRAHKNKTGTPPPNPKYPPPPKTRNFMDMKVFFSAERTQKFQAPIKLAQPFPAPELRTRILRTRGFCGFFQIRDVPTQIPGHPGHSLSKTTEKGHMHKVFVWDIPTSGPLISQSAKTKRGRREGDGKKNVTTIYDNLRHFATFYDNFRLFIPLT